MTSCTSSTSPDTLPPVTPKTDEQHGLIRVHLPAQTNIICMTKPSSQPDDLVLHLLTALAEWAQTLWHHIHPVSNVDALWSALVSNQYIIACSNAAIDAAKYSCCTWTIYSWHILWGESNNPWTY